MEVLSSLLCPLVPRRRNTLALSTRPSAVKITRKWPTERSESVGGGGRSAPRLPLRGLLEARILNLSRRPVDPSTPASSGGAAQYLLLLLPCREFIHLLSSRAGSLVPMCWRADGGPAAPWRPAAPSLSDVCAECLCTALLQFARAGLHTQHTQHTETDNTQTHTLPWLRLLGWCNTVTSDPCSSPSVCDANVLLFAAAAPLSRRLSDWPLADFRSAGWWSPAACTGGSNWTLIERGR